MASVRLPKALYAYGRFASGVPILPLIRRMYRDKWLFWNGDPFETFEEYLSLPRGRPVGRIIILHNYQFDGLPTRTGTLASCYV